MDGRVPGTVPVREQLQRCGRLPQRLLPLPARPLWHRLPPHRGVQALSKGHGVVAMRWSGPLASPRDLTARTPHRLLPALLPLQDMRFWSVGEDQLTAVYNTWCALCTQAWAPRPHRPDPQRFRIYVYELPLPLALAEQLDFGQMHVNLEFYQAWR